MALEGILGASVDEGDSVLSDDAWHAKAGRLGHIDIAVVPAL